MPSAKHASSYFKKTFLVFFGVSASASAYHRCLHAGVSYFCSQFFQLFSNVLTRFCPLQSKNAFVLVLAHLEPELELFEVDDIGDDGDDDL